MLGTRIAPDLGGAAMRRAPTSWLLDAVSSVEVIAHWMPGNASSRTMFAWEDAGDFENHIIASGDMRPQLGNMRNGKPGAIFDGVGTLLRCYSLTGIGAGSKPAFYFVCVGDSDQLQSTGTLLYAHDLGDPGIDQLTIIEHKVSAVRISSRLGSVPTSSSASASGVCDDVPHVLKFVAANSSDRSETWVDGELEATASGGDSGGIARTVTHVSIGGTDQSEGAPSVRWWKGTLYEGFVLSGVPTSNEDSAIMDRLSMTWSL